MDTPSNTGTDSVITPLFISTWSSFVGMNVLVTGAGQPGGGITGWNTANQALYIPMRLPWSYYVARAAWYNGSNHAANADIGIYTSGGALLWSAGKTSQSGSASNVPQYFTVGMLLNRGDYFLGFSVDITSAGEHQLLNPGVTQLREGGCYEQASACPLPSQATFSVISVIGQYPLLALTKTASGF